ncbi:MAG: IPT/TIG domain-containing protein, partial [Myxococcota bacterium]
MLLRLGVLAASLCAASAAAGTKYVTNDTFTGSGAVNTGVSFGEYQGAGVLFTPSPADYPLRIKGVDVFLATYQGGAPGLPCGYVASVWDESGGTLTPPRAFDGGTYRPQVNMLSVQFTTSTTMLNRVVLTPPMVVDAGRVFVQVSTQNQTSLDDCTIALDNGPLVPGANWFFNGYGYFFPVDLPDGGRPYGITQNWIIRLALDVPDAPVLVTSVNPSSGPNSTPTDVTLTGNNFELGAEAFLGATALTMNSVNATTISATVPAGLTPGVYDVLVRNPSGAEGTLPNGYRVLLPDGGTGAGGGAGGGGG